MSRNSTAPAACFSSNYGASRRLFLDLAGDAGAAVSAFNHPDRVGPTGEDLSTEVACFGSIGAPAALFVVCGTHGVEGLCGAGIQAAVLRRGLYRERATDMTLVLVHALNPYGFAYLRRTNEDNIDLNRNFLDHSGSYPDDSAYSQIHSMLVPADWDGPARSAADAALARYNTTYGASTLQANVTRGQYTHADGLFFGGRKRAWSNVLWCDILRKYAGRARHVAVIDLHSGLGARGACELISGASANSKEHRLARRWFGDELVFPGLTSTAAAAQGYMGNSLAQALPSAAGALVVAEFGTLPFDAILQTLRADNWLHARGDLGSPQGRQIKEDMRAAFVGDDPAWQSAVIDRAAALIRRVSTSLTNELRSSHEP